MQSRKKTIALFGYGPGLGASVARRFGHEGCRVALVARNGARLAASVAELAALGVEAAAFPADLNDIAAIPALVRSIEDRFGCIDIAVYAPVPANTGFVAAADLDAQALQPLLNIFTIAPIAVVHAILPGMLARGDGAIVVVSGASAVTVEPGWSGPGPALAATRNFILTLNAECMPRGVYAGSVSIFAGIEGSAHMDEVEAENPFDLAASEIPWISPDSIADEILALVTRRDRAELHLPAHASNPSSQETLDD